MRIEDSSSFFLGALTSMFFATDLPGQEQSSILLVRAEIQGLRNLHYHYPIIRYMTDLSETGKSILFPFAIADETIGVLITPDGHWSVRTSGSPELGRQRRGLFSDVDNLRHLLSMKPGTTIPTISGDIPSEKLVWLYQFGFERGLNPKNPLRQELQLEALQIILERSLDDADVRRSIGQLSVDQQEYFRQELPDSLQTTFQAILNEQIQKVQHRYSDTSISELNVTRSVDLIQSISNMATPVLPEQIDTDIYRFLIPVTPWIDVEIVGDASLRDWNPNKLLERMQEADHSQFRIFSVEREGTFEIDPSIIDGWHQFGGQR